MANELKCLALWTAGSVEVEVTMDISEAVLMTD